MISNDGVCETTAQFYFCFRIISFCHLMLTRLCLFFLFKEMSTATQLNFLELKNKEGEDVIYKNTLKRCQKCTNFMHKAAATAALDPVSRADVALRCVCICWRGLRVRSISCL